LHRKLCVIVNPMRLRGGGWRRWRAYHSLLGDDADVRMSTRAGHAEELARAAVNEGFATIVAAGGDGTIHQVVNGMLANGPVEAGLGVLPLGSGNDYAHSLGLPRSAAELTELLLGQAEWRVDVGHVTDDRGRRRLFVNTLGVGLNGAVTWEKQKLPWLRGIALYGVAALKSIWRHFKTLPTRLTIDGVHHDWPTTYLAIALGQREGGGFRVAPTARLDDGLFDYLHAASLSRLGALRYLPRLARGDIPQDDPAIRQGQCQAMIVEGGAPLPIHLDGEPFTLASDDVRRIEVKIMEGALRVRCLGRR
jgi:YegS/Rv2252/BmrU family lipid kinase